MHAILGSRFAIIPYLLTYYIYLPYNDVICYLPPNFVRVVIWHLKLHYKIGVVRDLTKKSIIIQVPWILTII